MAKYIKQEMNDLRGSGENKVFYRLERAGNFTSSEFIKRISAPGTGVTEGTVMQVLSHVATELAALLAEGYSVALDGIGTFSATVGVVPCKELDGLEEKATQLNARSLQLDGVNYRAARSLLADANRVCKLERGEVCRLQPSPYSREERLQLAVNYLQQHPFMRIADYMELTKQSRFVATKELMAFREQEGAPLTTTGRGGSKLYVLKR
ncbi:MAG: DNA-binding protein [Phocaeicola sp.]